jgi:hypothetical protein
MKLAHVLSLVASLCLFVFVSVAVAGGGASQTVDPSQVKQLQEQMLGNPGIMALITALQSDPDMQALLSDPAFVEAVQKGDAAALSADSRFQKLLNNPKVQAIVNQMR